MNYVARDGFCQLAWENKIIKWQFKINNCTCEVVR